MSDQKFEAANALVEAQDALRKAHDAVSRALALIGTDGPVALTRERVAERTTATQVLSILSSYAQPLTLIDIAEGVIELRRDEDTPKGTGGTRYQELVRSSLLRLINKGIVERVPPSEKKGFMRFRRTSLGEARP